MKELPEQGIKFAAVAKINIKVEAFLNIIFYSSYYNSDLCTTVIKPLLLSSAELWLTSNQAQGSPLLPVTMQGSYGQ